MIIVKLFMEVENWFKKYNLGLFFEILFSKFEIGFRYSKINFKIIVLIEVKDFLMVVFWLIVSVGENF